MQTWMKSITIRLKQMKCKNSVIVLLGHIVFVSSKLYSYLQTDTSQFAKNSYLTYLTRIKSMMRICNTNQVQGKVCSSLGTCLACVVQNNSRTGQHLNSPEFVHSPDFSRYTRCHSMCWYLMHDTPKVKRPRL